LREDRPARERSKRSGQAFDHAVRPPIFAEASIQGAKELGPDQKIDPTFQ